MSEHHTFSPSSLERIESCPPSWKVCQDYVSSVNKDSSRGTLLHQAIYDVKALEQIESERDIELVKAIRNEHIEPLEQTDGVKIYNEFKVEISDNNKELLTFGTIDLLAVSEKRKMASLIDFKFGNVEVTQAQDNLQIITYVAGVFQKFPCIDTIFALIVQPVYGIDDYSKQAQFNRDMLPSLIARIESVINKAQKADTADLNQYNCSVNNCRYCNKAKCAKYRAWMNENMALVGVEDLPKEVAEMTLDYADKVKLANKAIVEAMKPVTEMAEKFIIKAGGSENYRVCDGRVTKKTDFKALCKALNVDDEQIKAFTTETKGEPYLSPKTRKKKTVVNQNMIS